MKNRTVCIALTIFVLAAPLWAGNPREEFDAHVRGAIAKLNREAVNAEGAIRLAGLIQSEYGTSTAELQWAINHEFPWGQMAAFAYIQATNGRSFVELSGENAAADLWSYTEKAGMNAGKMMRSLEQFSRRVEQERNSRIFEELRSVRTTTQTPDLGSGFGLFQEALDFRRIDDAPQPSKVFTSGTGDLGKGTK